ncbi:MAG: hypothetical protein D3913_10035 [Candidatus Electrothrix sp. LOE1_4_5]|nr:hypothetical protein [Candidatus Electrothrix gigas]
MHVVQHNQLLPIDYYYRNNFIVSELLLVVKSRSLFAVKLQYGITDCFQSTWWREVAGKKTGSSVVMH